MLWLNILLDIGKILVDNHLDEDIEININKLEVHGEDGSHQGWEVKVHIVKREQIVDQCIIIVTLVLVVVHIHDVESFHLKVFTQKDNADVINKGHYVIVDLVSR